MRILYIGDQGSVGGAARALVEVVTEVKKFGVEPIVVTSVYDNLNEEIESYGISTIACGHQSAMNPKSPYKWKRPLKYPYECLRYYKSLPGAIKTIEENIDIHTIDLIHTNSARNDIGCLLRNKYNIPHVMHIREFGQEDFECCVYRLNYYKYLNQGTDRFLAISKAVANSWTRKGINSSKLQVLYDGVDISKIQIKENYRSRNEDLHMVITGGVCNAKGQHLAIEAMGLLPDMIKPHVYLSIIGWTDPRYVERLKKIIESYKLEEQVSFLDARNDIYKVLKDYDVGLTCSRSEGFGRVTAEYLYAGLTAIGADTGATSELIKDQETGLIFSYDNVKDLSQKIVECYRNPVKMRKLGLNAHKDAERFSAVRNADEILEVYHSLL